jgi:hypothetical protein
MPATIDKAMIINWALTKIGLGPVFSTDDTSELALNIDNSWQQVVDTAFALDDWYWTKRTKKLARLATAPENGWAYGFELPADRIGPALAYFDRVGIDRHVLRNFHLEGNTAFADVPDLWAEFRVVIAIDDWDVAFRAAFVKLLASELAIPVWQDKTMRDELRAECFGTASEKMTGGLFGRLMAQNKAAAPIGAEAISTRDPLDDARYGAMGRDSSWAGRFA